MLANTAYICSKTEMFGEEKLDDIALELGSWILLRQLTCHKNIVIKCIKT